MPDFAPNFTARYRVRYSVHGRQHNLQFRMPAGTLAIAAPGIATKVAQWLDDLAVNRYTDWTVIGASFAPANSDVFLPVAAPAPVAGTFPITGRFASSAALAISFVGRSDAGLRAAVYLYGTALLPSAIADAEDFRIYNTEDATIAAAITTLQGDVPFFVANDDELVNWYPYVNVKYNDYWVRRTRG